MANVKSGDVNTLFDSKLAGTKVSFAVGAPGPKTLKRTAAIFAAASAAVTNADADEEAHMFQYGPRAGYTPFLEQLSKFLSRHYADEVSEDSLLLTTGASLGLFVAATTFLPTGSEGVVFLECPSYFIASSVFKNDLGLTVVAVPMDSDNAGPDISRLRESFAKYCSQREKKGEFKAVYYTIPTYHNPLGVVFSAEKCRAIVELAREFDVLVICDDVYNLLHYEVDANGEATNPPKRLLAYDSPDDTHYKGGNVISNGSFSKILGPGIRVGWLEAPPKLREQIRNSGVINSGGSMNNVMSGVVAKALELGLQDRHLEHLRAEYRERIEIIFDFLENNTPEGFNAIKPKGGYFIWLTGPESWDSGKFCQWCAETYKVTLIPSFLTGTFEDGSRIENAARISFAYHEKDEIKEGMEIVCKALNEFVSK